MAAKAVKMEVGETVVMAVAVLGAAAMAVAVLGAAAMAVAAKAEAARVAAVRVVVRVKAEVAVEGGAIADVVDAARKKELQEKATMTFVAAPMAAVMAAAMAHQETGGTAAAPRLLAAALQ